MNAMSGGSRVLVVDDDEQMCALLVDGMRARAFDVVSSTRPVDAIAMVAETPFDVVVADLTMPGMDGLQLCEELVHLRPGLPVLVLTAFGSLDAAVGAIRAGAYDFIAKPVDLGVLELAIRRALDHASLRAEVRRLRAATSPARAYGPLLGDSAPMRRLYDLVDRCAGSDATVLVYGESGTGKELVARAIHEQSDRCSRPFTAVNCAGIPEALVESELFGHVAGSFTGAVATREGLLVRSHGGTVLLDEIGELPLASQAKLLRILQDRTVRPVGSDKDVAVDVRIVAATNVDLEEAVAQRRFREDLMFRLDVLSLVVPPLRARGNDILLLAEHFLSELRHTMDRPRLRLDPAAIHALATYRWPGNVRELRSCIERAATFASADDITVADLPDKLQRAVGSSVSVVDDETEGYLALAEVERRHILAVLDSFGGNKSEAGRVLGLDRRTVGRKLRDWGIPD